MSRSSSTTVLCVCLALSLLSFPMRFSTLFVSLLTYHPRLSPLPPLTFPQPRAKRSHFSTIQTTGEVQVACTSTSNSKYYKYSIGQSHTRKKQVEGEIRDTINNQQHATRDCSLPLAPILPSSLPFSLLSFLCLSFLLFAFSPLLFPSACLSCLQARNNRRTRRPRSMVLMISCAAGRFVSADHLICAYHCWPDHILQRHHLVAWPEMDTMNAHAIWMAKGRPKKTARGTKSHRRRLVGGPKAVERGPNASLTVQVIILRIVE